MQVKKTARIAVMLLLFSILAGNLWQCARDTTSSMVTGLGIALKTAGQSTTEIDQVEIEIWDATALVTVDTTDIIGGSFTSTIAVEPGGPYEVKAYAVGEGSDIAPASTLSGIVAIGNRKGIEVSAGQVSDPVQIVMDDVTGSMKSVIGTEGNSTLEVAWHSIDRSDYYTMGWFTSDGTIGQQSGIADTSAILDWSASAKKAFLAEDDDSVLFRIQPHFGQRAGVYSEGIWVTPAIWIDLPHVTSIMPGDAEIEDADTVNVWIKFDREIDFASLEEGIRWLQIINSLHTQVTINSISSPSTGLYKITPDRQSLRRGLEQQIVLLTTITDLEGRAFDADPSDPGLQGGLYSWHTAEYDPLHVIASTPEGGQRDVDPHITISLKLNRSYQAATLVDSVCYLTGPEEEIIAGTLIATSVDSIYFQPDEPLWFDSRYEMHLGTELLDHLGRPFDQNLTTEDTNESYDFPFTTMTQPIGPQVVTSIPAPGDTIVSMGTTIEIRFNLPVDPATVIAGQSVKLLRDGSLVIGGTITMAEENRVVYLKPTSLLNQNRRYLIRVTSDVKGINGIPLDQDLATSGYQDFSASFTTEDPPQVISIDPPSGTSGVNVDEPIELTFSRVLDPAALPTEQVRLIYNESAVACEQSLDLDSLRLTLTPEEPLSYVSVYSVEVDTLLRAHDGSYFDQDIGLPERQFYNAFFITQPESLHPHVTTITPPLDAQDVWVDDSVEVVFSMPMNPSTFDPTTSFVLNELDGEVRTQVAGIINLSLDQSTATFIPASNLPYGQLFEVAVSSEVTSISGFELDDDPVAEGLQPFTSTFTTVQEQVSPYVLFAALEDAIDVDVNSVVGIIFSEAMDADSLAAAFSLSDGETLIPGSGELNEAGDFWVFTPDEPLAWNTSFTGLVSTSARDLAGNPFDQNPATPELDPYQLTFTTMADQIPPTVISSIPAAGATGVDVRAAISATFSEELDPTTISPAAFHVREAQSGTIIQGDLSTENGTTTVVWTPAAESPMSFSTQYMIFADTLITDASGNLLDRLPDVPPRQIWSSFFTTMAETIPPQVTAVLPTSDPMPISADLTIVFSEAMSEGSLNEPGVISLGPSDGGDLPFTMALAASADSLHVMPTIPFASSISYTLTVDTLATDLLGNLLDNDPDADHRQVYTKLFTTEVDQVGPRVTSVVPDSGLVHLHAEGLNQIEINFDEPLQTGTIHNGSTYIQGVVSGLINCAISFENNNTTIILTPSELLPKGEQFNIIVTPGVRDPLNNQFDQDPSQPGNQDFTSPFGTGSPAVINWTGNQCPMGETAEVTFDARGSVMPDSVLFAGFPDSIVSCVWFWGDGTSDSLPAPGGLQQTHLYDMFDYNGCDGINNDSESDDLIDEEGSDGCDESYHVLLRLWDSYGFSITDTTGVSFCAYLVLDHDPTDQATGIDPESNIGLQFTRPVNQGNVTPSTILFTNEGAAVPYTTTFSDDGKYITIDPTLSLAAGRCSVIVDTTVRSDTGILLDQDLETINRQPLRFTFTVPE